MVTVYVCAISQEKIAKLKQNRWINAGTQWARIEVVVYNPNLSAFGVLQFKVDYDNSGVYMTALVSFLFSYHLSASATLALTKS